MSKTSTLSTQLSWQVGLVQVAMFMLSTIVTILILWDPAIRQVPRDFAEDVAEAIDRRDGQLQISLDRLPEAFRESEPRGWIAAVDDKGARVRLGVVPAELETLVQAMPRLKDSDIRGDSSELAAASVIVERDGGQLHVMVGGVPERSFISTIIIILRYIGIWIFLPVVLATVVVVSLVLHLRLRGLSRVAAQARAIDLSPHSPLLDARDVPGEIQPMIEAFNQALIRIRDAARVRDRFLSDAAHEIRMPIAVVGTRISTLPPSATRTHLVTDLARLENIAEQLLDLQRMEHHVDERNTVDLVALCREVAGDVAPLVVESGYSFAFDAPPAPVQVAGDPGALRRMVTNLLQNAVVHGGRRGEIQLIVRGDGRVEICDCGPGIPKEERDNIFAPFYRLNSGAKGSGLGLHLAREVAVRHGGAIGISESPTGGACFSVTLPTVSASDAQRGR